MPAEYDPTGIESKWQKKWDEAKVFEVDFKKAKNPYYTHVMWPYPSSDKLHVGHWYNFGPADSFARFMRMQGKDVFSPIGFDAFGLPAENYAIKTGVPPAESTEKNVETMIRQLKQIGCMYDWSKSANSSKPEYYKWTQWLFQQMYRNELAYRKEATVNMCPECKTVLANEQVWEGKCERCESEVVQKPLKQWFWKTTKYAQQMLDGLKDIDWPEKTKLMQKNWIGKSTGINFKEKVKDMDIEFEVFDTVPQTFFAQTFAIIAPEHSLVPKLVGGTKYEKPVMELVDRIKKKKAANRFNIETDMEGAFTGRYVDNPFGTGDLEIWVASFVVADYGTGIVNCSAHDDRDFEFAKKYDIPLKTVMYPEDPKEAEKVKNLEYCYCKDPRGILKKPKEFEGRRWGDIREEIMDFIEKKGFGERKTQFRLKDWLVSRQRYWGSLIPIVYDPEGEPHLVPEEHLPWMLPTDVEFKPTGTSPIADSKELKERTEKIFGKGWTPEVDTMDTFVCSSYYSYMFLAASNENGKYKQRDILKDKTLVDPALEKKWMPVDAYIGGAEHACMHLIYARFVTMALKDLGFVSHGEPFQRLVHQGVITKDGAKMSKSKGNVVSPDEFIEKYGSDVFRMYLMFMGPYREGGDWNDTGIKGVSRFAQKAYKIIIQSKKCDQDKSLTAGLHAAIKKVTKDVERLHFNTAISALMQFLNACEKHGGIDEESAKTFSKLLAPLAPHIAEELWEHLGGKSFVIEQDWPTFDPKLIVTDTVTIAVQVNGKLRGDFEAPTDISEKDAIAKAKEVPNVAKHLEGKKVKKEVYVEGKLVSLVL